MPFVTTDFHILGYVPRDAKDGCHRIRVEVNRPNLLVFARDEYCGGQSPSDPLVGTGQGKELDRILASEKRSKIPLSLQAATFYAGGNQPLVDLCLRFPWNDLYRKWEPSNWTLYARIGVMGVIRRKNGTVAARFSDLLYPPYWPTFDQGGVLGQINAKECPRLRWKGNSMRKTNAESPPAVTTRFTFRHG